MKIVVLVENTSREGLNAEHGLSFYIQFQGEEYLLDAGSSNLFMENAKTLGTDILSVKKCVLSHGHYDHSGGFADYLKENREAVVYAMENAGKSYYSASGGMHYIGVPKELLEHYGKKFCWVDDFTQIGEHVYLVPHNTKGLGKIGERAKLYVKQGETFMADDFSHELSLVFEMERGLVVFNSCSHGGIGNIINEVKERFPGKKIIAFLGGLHMKGKKDGKEVSAFTEEEIQILVACLKQERLQYLYTGHCTGGPAFSLLKKYAGEMVQELYTGKVIEI